MLWMTFLKFKTFGHKLYHPSAVLTQISGFPPFTILQEIPVEPVSFVHTTGLPSPQFP